MSVLLSRRSCLLAALGVVGCRSSGASGDSSDGSEQGIVTRRRVVSLTPNTTEAVFALGAGDRMVGRSRYCDHPPEATHLPVVGGYVDPSLETILGLRPDLVVGARGPLGRSLVDKIEARGTECYFPSTESVQEIFEMIDGLASRLDRKHESTRLLGSIRDHLRRIAASVEGSSRPRTLLVFGQAPISVAGPGSFPAEMLALAGCDNAVEHGARYPILGMETLLGLDPDMIFDATMVGGRDAEPIGVHRAGWASVRAVREGRVRRVDNDQILRPGPRLAEGVSLLARHAHAGIQIP